MRRMVGLPALLLAAACTNGPESITALEPVELEQGSYTLYGVVSESVDDGLRPSAGSEVTLARLHRPDDSRNAITDGRGRFSVTGLAAGRWTLTIHKPGYEIAVRQVEVGGDMSVSFVLERAGRTPQRDPGPRPV